MPRGQRFPIEVMLRAMREVDNGVPVAVVCRKVGMVEKTFYRYREKFISNALDQWAHAHGVNLHFSRPGKPVDNAFIESFNVASAMSV